MNNIENIRIAWVYPAIPFGAYWQPVIQEFAKYFKNTTFYTGCAWKGFDPDDPKISAFKVIGKAQYVASTRNDQGYGRAFIYASPAIIFPLLRSRPHLIFASAFSIWTVLVLLLKPVAGWRIVIIYDGSSPNSDFRDSYWRTSLRKAMAKFTDAFIANSQAAKQYLVEALDISENKIVKITYLVPDIGALMQQDTISTEQLKLKHPVFLFVGQLIVRKGIQTLLAACSILQKQGYENYSLVIIGEGEQRQDLEKFARENGLEEKISWLGWVDYGNLGAHFHQADVFVFPTFEDVWGMVVLEAMVFGNPVLCSKDANASEMVVDSVNGYIFDPHNPEELARRMKHFIEQPELTSKMAHQSQQLVSRQSAESVADLLYRFTLTLLDKNHSPYASSENSVKNNL